MINLENEDYYFAGLFIGEGSVAIARRRSPGNKSIWLYRPELVMRLRADDREIVDWIKNRYGGTVCRSAPSATSGNPMVLWQISGWSRVLPLVDIVIATKVPGKKMREFVLLREFCEVREQMPHLMGEKNRQILDGYYYRLCDMRVFKEPVNDQVISA